MRQADDGVHRRTDFVAHVGQEDALRLVRRFELRRAFRHQFFKVVPVRLQFQFLFLQLGDVDPKANNMAIHSLLLDDAQPAAIVQLLFGPGISSAVSGDPLGHPGVDSTDSLRILTALGPDSGDMLECCARHDQVGRSGVDLAILVIAEDQAVILVEKNKAFVDGIDRGTQDAFAFLSARLGELACGDVVASAAIAEKTAVVGNDRHAADADPAGIAPGCGETILELIEGAVPVQVVQMPGPVVPFIGRQFIHQLAPLLAQHGGDWPAGDGGDVLRKIGKAQVGIHFPEPPVGRDRCETAEALLAFAPLFLFEL